MNRHSAFVGSVGLLGLLAGFFSWEAMPVFAQTSAMPPLKLPEKPPIFEDTVTVKTTNSSTLLSTQPNTELGNSLAGSKVEVTSSRSIYPSENQQVEDSTASVLPSLPPDTDSLELRSSAFTVDSSSQPIHSKLLTQVVESHSPASSPMGQVTSVSQLTQDSSLETSQMGQVTSVSQLSDVQPNDWAFEALQSLVERYGCIAGYLDGTFRGNRALTRYEFAAGLNACLQQVERLIAANTAEFVSREDLTTLQRLVNEFEAELATLGTRVDDLEGRVAVLEDIATAKAVRT